MALAGGSHPTRPFDGLRAGRGKPCRNSGLGPTSRSPAPATGRSARGPLGDPPSTPIWAQVTRNRTATVQPKANHVQCDTGYRMQALAQTMPAWPGGQPSSSGDCTPERRHEIAPGDRPAAKYKMRMLHGAVLWPERRRPRRGNRTVPPGSQ